MTTGEAEDERELLVAITTALEAMLDEAGVTTAAAVVIETDAADVETTDADGNTVEEATADDSMVEDAGTLEVAAAMEEELAITEVVETVNEELATAEPEELAWKNVPDNFSATPSATNF